jgi:hypothetical protein
MLAPKVRGEDLLRAHEARGLFGSIAARLGFLAIITLLIVAHLLRWLREGVIAETDGEAYRMLALAVGDGLAMLHLLRLTRDPRKLVFAGVGAALLDVALPLDRG